MTHVWGKVVVVGVGLIGGSFALALKRAGAAERIVGVGRSRESLDRALALRVIDVAAPSLAEALVGADLVLVAAPVQQAVSTLYQLAAHLEPETALTDAGSTKQDIVAAAYAALGERVHQFVPAHPIAGAELSGVAAARWELFERRRVVLTPLPESADWAVSAVRRAWGLTGAYLTEIPPAEHDRVFAAVSHLPHLLAYALTHELSQRPDAEQLFGYAAGGFRDFTRIAGSHPEMWRDISLANRDFLLAEIDSFQTALGDLRRLIDARDGPAIEAIFSRARLARERWLAQVELKQR
jgi:prephenate dehydrogenase